ncbi:1,2-phenylacetyl-CoA epoxidase subunit PaaD [Deinococcus pimensis]|uniref:1,2-phenylacetyl-CoA epoxidase subunit PaaD n=1 Tax=Deinococcus pimensis TaxID=309888 RepID=UPI00048210F4|nr:1,2-phenylacetyl-CoA epoxidase subunit PaaD [Deinococcus pimensis]
MSAAPARRVWDALARVADPEIPVVNIVEMGIVRDVRVDGERAVVDMTPTFSACPALHVIRDAIAGAVRAEGLTPEVRTVLSPPWTTDWITEEARAKLETYGIAPPAPTGEGTLIQLEMAPPRCPRCGSFDTGIRNTFGSTLCKTLHVCHACGEPFEAFKSL